MNQAQINRNLPNVLTFVRLIGGALCVPFLIYYLLPYQISWLNLVVSSVFFLFSMTDFLDGYLARKYGLETPIGRALDPIADKFLVCAALISLLAIQKIYFIWVIILIGRELSITSLRQFAALHNICVSVSYLGKIKACLQMALIIVLIARPASSMGLYFSSWSMCENILLLATLYFSLISFYRYAREFGREYYKIN